MNPIYLLGFSILDNTGCGGNDQATCGIGSITALIGNIIKIGLFAAGALSVIFLVIGGFQYVVSAGNPQATARAKSTITFAIIGLLLAIFSFAIVNFIIGRFI